MRPDTALKILRVLLLVMGGLAMLATIAVVMPSSWMAAANDLMGLEAYEQTPLTEYLTRSASALYALIGALVFYIGLHARRYLDLVRVMGWLTAVFGVALTGVDLAVGMPALWTWGEGPPTVLVGLAFAALARRATTAGTPPAGSG